MLLIFSVWPTDLFSLQTVHHCSAYTQRHANCAAHLIFIVCVSSNACVFTVMSTCTEITVYSELCLFSIEVFRHHCFL